MAPDPDPHVEEPVSGLEPGLGGDFSEHFQALNQAGDEPGDFAHRNRISQSLLHAFYERTQAEKQKPGGTSDLHEGEFRRVWEEIALALWHGRGRTTIPALEAHFRRAHLEQLLHRFQTSLPTGLADHLRAFCLRSAGANLEEESYAFTHPAFGTYLLACRLVRGIERIHKGFQAQAAGVDRGGNEQEALARWVRLCDPTPMDRDLLHGLRARVAERKTDGVSWQNTLTRLMNHLLRHGLPMDDGSVVSYNQMTPPARNATTSLLAALNACVRLQGNPHNPPMVAIRWPDAAPSPSDRFDSTIAAHAFLQNVRGAGGGSPPLFLDCLTAMDFRNCYLADLDLPGANLEGAFLQEAELVGSNLKKANLRRAKLWRASLIGAQLQGADLSEAKMQQGDLTGTQLQGANLDGANLDGAQADDTTVFPEDFAWERYQKSYPYYRNDDDDDDDETYYYLHRNAPGP